MDVEITILSKLEYGKIQLAECKDMILLFGFYGNQITDRNFSRRRKSFLTGNNANIKKLSYTNCGSVA
jgi:hypothetical protein